MRTNGKIQLFPLLRLAVCLIAGMSLGSWLDGVVEPAYWLCGFEASVVCFFILHRLWRPISEGVFMLLGVLMLGGWLMAEAELSSRMAFPEGTVAYDAVVVSEPQVRGKVVRCDLLLVGGGKPLKMKASILRDTVENRWQRLHVGDGIHAASVVERPKNFIPDSSSDGFRSTFDYARWLVVHGYRAQTFIYYRNWQKAEVSLLSLSVLQRARLRALLFRQRLVEQYRSQGLSGREQAVLSAMTLGDKSLLDNELKNVYSVSGASHVLALSGLHLGIIYALLTMFAGRHSRRRWVVQLLAVVAIWAYAVMVGLSPSVVRSALMLTVYASVEVIGHNRMSLNTLSLAAIVMLVAQPLTLFDVGFQLSFLSVLFILLLANPLESFFLRLQERVLRRFLPQPLRQRFPTMRWLWAMLAVSISAQLGTAPLVAFYFGRFSCYSVLTSLFVIPLAVAILYGAVLFFLLSPVPSWQSLLAQPLLWVVGLLNSLLDWVAALPGASIEHIRLSPQQVFLLYVLMGCLAGLAHYAKKLHTLRVIAR